MPPTVVAIEVGWRAQAALARSHGHARRLAGLSESVYVEAAGEVVWLGRAGAPRHGRAALVATLPPVEAEVMIDGRGASCWRPQRPASSNLPAVTAGCRHLLAAIGALGTPLGFGTLLAGAAPPWPLASGAASAAALADACVRDDPRRALAAARPLIGLGPGLTPAGDDYAGAAFFARAVLGPQASRDATAWAHAAAGVRALAAGGTHPISATLLADLTAGDGYAPLHDLAGALAAGASVDLTLDAAHRLTRIGHSSGWDLLAGFIGAILGQIPAPAEGRSIMR